MVVGTKDLAIHDVFSGVAVAGPVGQSGDHGRCGVLDDIRFEKFTAIVNRRVLDAVVTWAQSPRTEQNSHVGPVDRAIRIDVRWPTGNPPFREEHAEVTAADRSRPIKVGRALCVQRCNGNQPETEDDRVDAAWPRTFRESIILSILRFMIRVSRCPQVN